MRRTYRIGVLMALLLALAAVGCSPRGATTDAVRDRNAADEESATDSPGGSGGSEDEENGGALSDDADGNIPVEGVNEQKAYDAIPAALQAAAQMKASAGLPAIPDLTGVEPKLEAYLLRGQVGTEIVLFQVGADGVVREMYGGTRKANPANLLVQDSSVVGLAPSTEPASEREKKAAAAVVEMMEQAFPGESVSAVVTGYRFVWETDPVTPYRLEIAPDGSVISTS